MSDRPESTRSWSVPSVPGLRVEILCGACEQYGRDWGAGGRQVITDDFTRLYALDSGEGEVCFSDGRQVRLRPGELYLIPAGRPARYSCSDVMQLAWVHLRIEVLHMVDLFSRWEPPDSIPCDTDTRQVLGAMIEELRTPVPCAAFARAAGALSLLRPFLPDSWEELLPPRDAQERLRPTLKAMVQDMCHPWTLAELAALVHLHPTYYSNLFRDTFGVPPIRYLGRLRMRRARDLLTQTDQRIGDIALMCGFDNPLHFSRVFRKATGVSPREFRKRGGGLTA